MRNSIRVPRRILQREDAAKRMADQSDLVDPERAAEPFDVLNESAQRIVAIRWAFRVPTAALIEVHHSERRLKQRALQHRETTTVVSGPAVKEHHSRRPRRGVTRYSIPEP